MKKLPIAITALSISAFVWGQADEGPARAAIEKMYGRIDAALARRDVDEINRLVLPDAWVGVPGIHFSLRAWMHAAMIRPGLTSRSEVTEFRLAGETATVLVRRHVQAGSNGAKREDATDFRDTWVHREDGWAWKESVELSGQSRIPQTSPEAARPVVDELKRRANRLAMTEAVDGFEDLRAFGDAVGNARIVALGEATHGTREFYRMKLRLLRYLVQEKGFTVLAMEVNWPDSLPVDHYIKTGEGDWRRGLAPAFDEVREMVEWMRSYNRGAAGRPLLTYTSFDMQGLAAPEEAVLAYLKRYAADEAPGAEAAYTEASRIWRDRASVFLADAPRVAREAGKILERFDAHHWEWAKISSQEGWRDARQAAAVIVQSCAMRSEANGLLYRDKMMASNIEWLADQVHPGEKIVISAHNGHVGSDPALDDRKMGGWLRQRFGKDMYAVGFTFRRGEVWAGGMEDGNRKGARAWAVYPSPEGSGDAILSAAGMPTFFLNMAGLPRDGPLARWLTEEHLFHHIGGLVAIGGESLNLQPTALSKSFDGIIFFEDTRASQPLGATTGGR